jgi:hypothetical protein
MDHLDDLFVRQRRTVTAQDTRQILKPLGPRHEFDFSILVSLEIQPVAWLDSELVSQFGRKSDLPL